MDQQRQEELRRTLTEDRDTQLAFLADYGAEAYSDEVGELDVGDDGFADSGQATEARSELLGHIAAARRRVQMIDDALQRMEAGEYGRCASCGDAIDEGRLEVRPLSIRCVTCADTQSDS